MNGKGSAPRPKSVDEQTFADHWARTFGTTAKIPTTDELDSRLTMRQANLDHARKVILGESDAAVSA